MQWTALFMLAYYGNPVRIRFLIAFCSLGWSCHVPGANFWSGHLQSECHFGYWSLQDAVERIVANGYRDFFPCKIVPRINASVK